MLRNARPLYPRRRKGSRASRGGRRNGEGFEFHYNVKVDEDGRAASVKSDVFHADFDGCTRAALRAMEISPEFLRTWVLQPLLYEEREDGQTNAARASVGNLVMVMGVAVALAPIIIKAAGITIIFAITLEIAEEVVEAIRRRRNWKDKCTDSYVECMDSDLGDEPGNNWNITRCGTCLEQCNEKNNWVWPSHVPMGDGLVPCGRLGRTWRKN